MAETNLQLKVTQAGAAQTAADLQKVADAQGLVGARVDATAKMAEAAQPAVQALAEAQAKLNELRAQRDTARESGTVGEVLQLNDAIGEQEHKVNSLSGEMAGLNVRSHDYVGLLNQIDPRLGAVAASLTRANRIAGEFGISLATVGLVIGGIYAVGQAVAYVAEQLEKATEATKKFEEANKKFLQVRFDQRQDIADIAAKRSEGGFKTPDEARKAAEQAARVTDRFKGVVSPDAVKDAAGFLGDKGLTDEELARAAFASERPGGLELDPEAREESRRREVQRATDRSVAVFDRQVALRRAQVPEDVQEAAKQATGGGGPELDKASRTAMGSGTSDEDAAQVSEDVRSLKTPHRAPPLWQALLPEFMGGKSTLNARLQMGEERAAKADTVINYITNQNQNQRHIGSDGRAQRGRMSNGDERVKSIEGWGGG